LFPSAAVDESFAILLHSDVNRVLEGVEQRFKLPDNALGRVSPIRYSLAGRRAAVATAEQPGRLV